MNTRADLGKPASFQFTTVLPAKSDNDVMFCLQSYQVLRIDRINTQVIYRFVLAQVK